MVHMDLQIKLNKLLKSKIENGDLCKDSMKKRWSFLLDDWNEYGYDYITNLYIIDI